jgi:hypothetical protein
MEKRREGRVSGSGGGGDRKRRWVIRMSEGALNQTGDVALYRPDSAKAKDES